MNYVEKVESEGDGSTEIERLLRRTISDFKHWSSELLRDDEKFDSGYLHIVASEVRVAALGIITLKQELRRMRERHEEAERRHAMKSFVVREDPAMDSAGVAGEI